LEPGSFYANYPAYPGEFGMFLKNLQGMDTLKFFKYF
jgi:hypothetical protein